MYHKGRFHRASTLQCSHKAVSWERLQWEWNTATNFKDIYEWKGLPTKWEKPGNIKQNSANTYII